MSSAPDAEIASGAADYRTDSGSRASVRRGWSLLTAEALACGSALVAQLAIARCLGGAAYGRYVLLNTLLQFLLVASSGGAPQALRWVVSRGVRDAGRALQLVLVFHAPLAVAAGAILARSADVLAEGCGDAELAGPVYFAAIDFSVRAGLFDPICLLLNAVGRQHLQALATAAFSLLRLAAVFALLGGGAGLSEVLAGLAAASALATALSLATLWKVASPWDAGSNQPLWSSIGQFYRLNVVGDTLFSLALLSSLTAARAATSDAGAFAILSTCYATIQGPLAVGRAALSTCYPALASAAHRGDRESISSALGEGVRLLLRLNTFMIAVCCVRGEAIIRGLFGAGYERSGAVEAAIVAAGCGFAFIVLFGGALTAAGDLRGRLDVIIPVVLASGPAAYAVSTRLGAGAASYSLALIGVTGGLAMGWRASARAGPFMPWASLARCFASGASVSLLALAFPFSGIASVLVDTTVLFAIYLAGLYLTGETL